MNDQRLTIFFPGEASQNFLCHEMNGRLTCAERAVIGQRAGTVIEIYFQHYKAPHDATEKRLELKEKLERIPGIKIPKNRLSKRPNFKWSVLANPQAMETFLQVFREFIADVKAYEGKRVDG